MEFIADTSPSFTSAFAQEIRDASRSLKDLAERGRVVPEVGHGRLREIFVRRYRIIYKVEVDQVTIVALWQGKRAEEREPNSREIYLP